RSRPGALADPGDRQSLDMRSDVSTLYAYNVRNPREPIHARGSGRKAAPDMRARRLDTERIVTEALELVNKQGVDALTMRSLAARLGAKPMALYRYFPSKDQLLDAMHGCILGKVSLPRRHARWDEELRRLVRAYRRALKAYPRALPL